MDESKILMYADDTVVFTSGNDISGIGTESQRQFDNIISCCELNRLTINEKKTKTTISNNNNNDFYQSITFKDQPLENIRTYKYLGVVICDDLNTDTYVNDVYKKVNNKVYVYKHSKVYHHICSNNDI